MSRLIPNIRHADVAGRTLLIRADLNVPMRGSSITDPTRIERFAPTVGELASRGAKIVVMTHLGRPEPEPNPAFSTRPIADALARILGKPVHFAPDCVGAAAEKVSGALAAGEIALLENLRFHKGEEANERNFAVRLSANGDLYVNDAFSCAHRAHASTHAIARVMPAYAGPSLAAEIDALEMALGNPRRPVVAIVGGAKVSTKIAVLGNLAAQVDHLVIGGGMANTFLAASGHGVGTSLCERSMLSAATDVLALARAHRCEVVLPSDAAVAESLKEEIEAQVVAVSDVPPDRMILDAGPESIERVRNILRGARTLIWNGPLGAFEVSPFDRATMAVAKTVASLCRAGRLVAVAGGGDTVAALNMAGVTDDLTYVSTAGGAFLEWMEGRPLPGIEALLSNERERKVS